MTSPYTQPTLGPGDGDVPVACSLADVDNVSIAGIWLKVFAQLPAAGLATCRLVCKLWARDVGDGVNHIKYHCTEEVPRPYLQQQDLVALASAFRNVEELDVNYPYTEWLENLSREYHKVGVHADEADWLETPVLNFQTISLPRLRKLKLTCVPLAGIHFTASTTPALEDLYVGNYGMCDWEPTFYTGVMHVHLPLLQTLMLVGIEMQASEGLERSLNRCPQLRSFTAQELYGSPPEPEYVHPLVLPECTSLFFINASDLYGLQVGGPKLTHIELAMCYGMRVLRLLGSEGPQVRVSFPDTELDPDSQQHLREHPRVGPDNVLADWPEG